jgi:hypothetical protein
MLSYQYNIPKSRKQQLVDFYLWSLYYQYPLNDISFLSESTVEDIKVIIKESTLKIVEKQKNDLLLSDLTAIAS